MLASAYLRHSDYNRGVKNVGWILLSLVVVAGCASKPETPSATTSNSGGGQANQSPAPTPNVDDKALVLTGPGGQVKLGDTVEAAKKAFPPPAGSQQFESSMSYQILTPQGWTWVQEKEKHGFEAATKDGKIVALGRTNSKGSDEPAKTIKELGEPTRKAESPNGGMYAWEAGDNVRILVKMGPKVIMLGGGALTLIGRKEDLKLLNYDSNDPQSFVKQLDAMSDPNKQKRMQEAFKEVDKKLKSGN